MRTRQVLSLLLLVALSLLTVVAHAERGADAGVGDHDKTLAPYFHVEDGDPDVDALPLKATAADIEVIGVIANVTVTQTYANEGKKPINAKYVFPASTRAAVHGMKMTVGDRVIEAKIRERQQARDEYEAAVREGKSASLLEQQRPNVFTMQVGNVMPGDTIQVELRYTELLVPTEGVYELVYPTVVGPRYSNDTAATAPDDKKWVESPYTREAEAPTYTFALSARVVGGIPIKDVQVPSHQVTVAWPDKNEARITLDPRERDGGDRDFILRYRLAGDQIESGILLHQGDKESFFVLMVEPPARVAPEAIPPREYVFIVDVSGSMRGFPLDTTKILLRELIGSLRPTDTFNVILFSGDSRLMSPRSVRATRENIETALAVIDDESGGGGTELLPALEMAMNLPAQDGVSRSFIVVTDGYISQEKEMFQYVRRNLGKANVFSFGIGSDVNRYLTEGVAKAGLGEAFTLTDPSQAREMTARFKAYVEAPVLTDIDVTYDGFQVHDLEPAAIPDLMASRPLVVQGKWSGSPSGKITVTGVSGQGTWSKTIDVATATTSPRHEALSFLWARARIATLSDFNSGDETEAEKQEITRLGLAYNLLTRHTSFVAVLHKVRNTGDAARDVDQPLPLPQGVSNDAIGMEVGAEPGLMVLLLAGAAVGLVIVLRRRHAS